MSRNSAWRFRSSTEGRAGPGLLAAATMAAALGIGACGGDDGDCGPAAEAGDQASVTAGGETLTYDGFTSSPNNDCPPPEGGPTSLTIDGTQSDIASQIPRFLTFCLPRPAEIGTGPIALDNSDLILVENVNGDLADDCSLSKDSAGTPSGTVEIVGFCDDGLDPAGFALQLSGTVPGIRRCPDGAGGTTDEPVTIDISGTVRVEAVNL